jgi:hypothetical protein
MHDPEIDFLYDQLKKLSLLNENKIVDKELSDKQFKNTHSLKTDKVEDDLLGLINRASRNSNQTLGEYLRSQNQNIDKLRAKYEVESMSPISDLLLDNKNKKEDLDDPLVQLISKQLDKVGFGKKNNNSPNQKNIQDFSFQKQVDDEFSEEKIYNLANKKKRKRIGFLEPRKKTYANTVMRLTNDMRFAPLDLPKYTSS